MLPESLLYVLERRGAAAFAAAIVADSDSPELVWTRDMRSSVLIPQVRPIRQVYQGELYKPHYMYRREWRVDGWQSALHL